MNEDDIRAKINKFAELEKENIIDGSLWTTDTKQATVGILRMFDLGFEFKTNPFERKK